MRTLQNILSLESDRRVAQAAIQELPRSAASRVFLVLLGLLALVGMLAIWLPFAGPIVLASALSITAYPAYQGIGRHWPWLSPTVRALLTDLAILIFVLLPVMFLIWTAIGQADNLRPVLTHWVQASQALHDGRMDGSLSVVRPFSDAMSRQIGISRVQSRAWLVRSAARGVDQLADWATQAAGQLLRGLISLLLCPLITYFELRHGPEYVARLSQFLPLRVEDKQRLINRTRDATVAVVRGLFLTALLEGAVATLGYTLMGNHPAVLLGVITGCASIVPVFGTTCVWVPVGLATILSGRVISGVLILVWGMGMVAFVDSFAAPWLVGHRIHMNLLPLLFGILGGAAVFGIKGLLIGPLIVIIAPTILEIVRCRLFAPPDEAQVSPWRSL